MPPCGPCRTLSRENADYILGLPRGPVTVETFQVFHGSPYDEDEYVIAAGEADEAFSYLESRVAFFGHTHVQGGFIWNQSRVETILRTPARSDSQSMTIDPCCAYMINPGSIRPAARRRPAGGFCDLRHRRERSHLPPGSLRRRRGAGEDSRCRAAADSGRHVCPWAVSGALMKVNRANLAALSHPACRAGVECLGAARRIALRRRRAQRQCLPLPPGRRNGFRPRTRRQSAGFLESGVVASAFR